jgi:transcriptional regulator GlxA family with amidase domain
MDNDRADPAKPVRVGVVVVPGCLTVAAAGLVDIFAVANRWSRQQGGARLFEVEVLAPTAAPVYSFTGYALPTDGVVSDYAPGDILICSAVASHPGRVVGEVPELIGWLEALAPQVPVASVCTGAFFLAEAGLLDGEEATTNPMFEGQFRDRYPGVRLATDQVLVRSGRTLTAGTVTAGLHLGLHLVEQFAGVRLASLTARALAVDKNKRSQLPYALPRLPRSASDSLVVRVLGWLGAHLGESGITLATLARQHGVSVRTLSRRFQEATGITPLAALRGMRLEQARSLLEATTDSVDEITVAVGYQDARSFTRLFRREVGVTPTEYRRRFGARHHG